MVLSVNSCGSAIAEVSRCSPPAAGRRAGRSGTAQAMRGLTIFAPLCTITIRIVMVNLL